MDIWHLADEPLEPHHPRILRTDPGANRVIALALPAGELLQDHEVRERALVFLVAGRGRRARRRWRDRAEGAGADALRPVGAARGRGAHRRAPDAVPGALVRGVPRPAPPGPSPPRAPRPPSRWPGRRPRTSSAGPSAGRGCCRAFTSVVVSRAPLAPSGWPRAIAPPFTFTLSSDAPVSACQASTTGANASLTSNRSMSAIDMPAFSSTLAVAGITPVSIITGSSPATENACSRAFGSRPSSLAISGVVIITRRAAVVDRAGVARGHLPVDLREPLAFAPGPRTRASARPASPAWCRGGSTRRCPGHPRDQLVVERPVGVRGGGALVALHREPVELGARQLPLGGDQLGADALGHQAVGVAGGHAGAERVGAVR